MNSQKNQAIKLEANGERGDYDPLDESIVEDRQENEDAVIRK